MSADYEKALDDVRRAIWTELAESQRPKHIERKGLDRALEIIDRVAGRKKR